VPSGDAAAPISPFEDPALNDAPAAPAHAPPAPAPAPPVRLAFVGQLGDKQGAVHASD